MSNLHNDIILEHWYEYWRGEGFPEKIAIQNAHAAMEIEQTGFIR